MFARVRFLCTSVFLNSILFVEVNSYNKETHDCRTPNRTPRPVMANVKIDDRSLSGQVICIFNRAWSEKPTGAGRYCVIGRGKSRRMMMIGRRKGGYVTGEWTALDLRREEIWRSGNTLTLSSALTCVEASACVSHISGTLKLVNRGRRSIGLLFSWLLTKHLTQLTDHWTLINDPFYAIWIF